MPRSDGSCGLIVSLAGRSLASVTAIGSVSSVTAPLATTVRFCVPIGAFSGTSSRSCSVVLSLVATIAAAAGWPPPSSVTVQPCGAPSTESAKRSGGSA